MADTLKITDVLHGSDGKIGLVLEHGGEKLVYSSKGLTTFAELGQEAKLITGPKADFIIQESLIDLATKTKDLPTSVKDALPQLSGLYANADAGLVDIVTKKAALVTAAEKGTVDEIKHAVENLPKGVAPKDVLSTDILAKAEKTGFDFAAYEKATAEAASKLATTEKATGALKTLFEAKELDVKAINKHLIANYEHLDELAKLEAPKGYNLQEAIGGIRREVGRLTTQAEAHYGEYVKFSDAAKLAAAKGETEAAKAAETAAKKALDNAQKITAGDYGAAVKSAVSKDVAETVALHNPTEAKALGKAASEAAKEAGNKYGLKFFSLGDQFKVTEGLKSKLLENAAGNAEKIAKIEKMEIGALRKTKLGLTLAGAGAVTYAAVAALGNKGPGKHAEQVAAQQQNAQPGLAVG